MTTYSIDTAHSDVSFSVRHMVFAKVRGHFTKWSANLSLDTANVMNSSVDVEIDASSIDTREPQRDGHLKSPDFSTSASTRPSRSRAGASRERGRRSTRPSGT